MCSPANTLVGTLYNGEWSAVSEERLHQSCAAVIKQLRDLDLTYEQALKVLQAVEVAIQRTIHQRVSVDLNILDECTRSQANSPAANP